MRRNRWAAAALALSAVVGVSAAAIAGSGRPPHVGPPQVEQVRAAITYTHVTGKARGCRGPEGDFVQERVRVTGTSTGDAWLTGKVTLHVKGLLNEAATGEGFQRGTLVIRNPVTGRKKVVARVVDAGIEEIFQGTLVGSVRNGNRFLIANWRTTFHENGAVTAQIGGVAPDRRLPAVVARGRCTGPFTSFDADIPPPAGAAAAGRAAKPRVGWLGR
jgi:hypothetical protein